MDLSARRRDALAAAQASLDRFDLDGAAGHVERAAALARRAGDAARAAHCDQMLAALHRVRGDPTGALQAARRMDAGAGGDKRTGFVARVERAEALLANGDSGAAARSYREALEYAPDLRLPPWAMATVLRRLAECDAGRGAWKEAREGFDAAAERVAEAGDAAAAAWIGLEHADRAWRGGRAEHARDVAGRDALIEHEAVDAHFRGERRILLARMAMAGGDVDAAKRFALDARDAALEAVAPLTYFAASTALAEALDARGERSEAYTALATAWASLGDLLGADVAESWVGPVLLAFRTRWGVSAFESAKAGHDTRRRQRLAERG